MDWLRELARRLTMLIHRRQFDADLEEEMRLHLELRQQEQLQSGMTTDDARAAARRRFGNTTYLKEESHIAWGWEWFENLGKDVRYGLRMLRKAPGFSTVAILTIALGIGANTAIFSIVNAVLLRPLPYPDPDHLVRIFFNEPGVGLRDVRFSKPEMDDLQTRAGVFEDVTPIFEGSENLTGVKQPERIEGVNTSFSYFSMLGVVPQIGRLYGPQDYAPGFAPEAVISDGLWRRAYGADPNVLGRTIRIDNDPLTIIGVLPRGFRHPGPTTSGDAEVFVAG